MRPLLHLSCALAFALLSSSCATQSAGPQSGKPQDATQAKAGAPDAVDLSLLLSMSFDEAASMAAQKAQLASGTRIAADKIEVLKQGASGATKVRATGNVFVQVHDSLPFTALCQEALLSDEDIILRGKPVTQRGVSLIQGTSEVTVFYMVGTRLRVIGRHKISEVASSQLADARSPGPSGSLPLPFFDAGPWRATDNPLLPPLEESVVPVSLRNDMRRAAEAEAALQKSREGLPPAFPEVKEEVRKAIKPAAHSRT